MEDAVSALKAVIFDVDGTLVEFKYDAKEVSKRVRTFILCNGMPEDLFKPDEPLSDNIERLKVYLIQKGDKEHLLELKDGVEKIMLKYEMKAVRSTRMLEGVEETLNELRAKGLQLTVLSNAGSLSLGYLLRRFNLEDRFDHIVSRDECEAMKPSPDGVKKLLELVGAKNDEVVLVGDSVIDMMAAQRAGVMPVGVASGARTAPELKKAGAAFVLESVVELPSLLDDLKRGKAPKSVVAQSSLKTASRSDVTKDL